MMKNDSSTEIPRLPVLSEMPTIHELNFLCFLENLLLRHNLDLRVNTIDVFFCGVKSSFVSNPESIAFA